MVNTNLKFSEYPFIVPNEKKVCKKAAQIVEELKACTTAQEAKKIIKKYNKFSSELSTQICIILVKYTCDTTNPEYKAAQDKVDELSPVLANYRNQFAKILVNAPYRPELEKEFGSYYFQIYDNSLRAFDEKIMPELIQQNKLTSRYDEILGGAQIPFRGEILNLSQLGKHMVSMDRNERKEAAKAMDKWLSEHDEELGNIYSELVTLRDTMAKKLGFKNYVELGYLNMGRTDYNAEMVAGYRKQIYEEVVPLCQKLYKQQMKRLGIKKPQNYDYNLRFASGNAKPAGDAKYLVKAAQEMYSSLSKESKEYFDHMVECELMDLEARAGKAPGGYCIGFDEYKTPFIFSNFNGTDADVNVLTHEGGHGFQGYICSGIKIPEYREPTMETAEIHSMSMEFFAWPYMEKFCGKDAEKYKYAHLTDAIEFLPYGITVDEFQHWVYEHPTATHEERCAIWRELEKKYTPHKKYDDCPTINRGRYWLRQSHIFGSPFYYIDYTLAQVIAFQFLVEDRKNHEKAWKKYVKLTKCGGKYPFTKLLEYAHVRNPFVDGNIHKVILPLKKILAEFHPEEY